MTKRQDRLEEKLDKALEGIGSISTDVAVLKESFRNSEVDREATQKSVEVLTTRVSAVEKFQTKVIGYASGAGAIIAAIGDTIKHKLGL